MAKAQNKISSLGTVGAFLNGRACSDTLFHVLDKAYDPTVKLEKRTPEERALVPLAGGIMQHGYQCGMLWGAAFAAGAQAYRFFGAGPQAEFHAIAAAEKVVEFFRGYNKTINCVDITGLNSSSTDRHRQ